MNKSLQWLVVGLVAIVFAGGLFYAAGFRVVGPNGRAALSENENESGSAKNQPGWRRAQGQQSGAMEPAGQGRMAQMDQNGGGGKGRRGSGGGTSNRGGSGGQGGAQTGGRQPGFGPTGGILLPIMMGNTPIPVTVGGKERASFVGQDLSDHVEDTVIATADGPRKGWSVAKTLQYLGIENYKEASFTGTDGKKAVVSLQQLNNPETIPLFTYNEQGRLMVVSGPKVRGTSKGMITLEEVQ